MFFTMFVSVFVFSQLKNCCLDKKMADIFYIDEKEWMGAFREGRNEITGQRKRGFYRVM